jgi:ATP-dependent DNA ligase
MPKAAARSTTSSWPAGADRESLPFGLTPMFATLSALPAEGEPYAFEYKWDGMRALAF